MQLFLWRDQFYQAVAAQGIRFEGEPVKEGRALDLAVAIAAPLISWTLIIASFSLDGKPRELCCLASFAVIAFHVGWYLSSKARRGGEGK